MNARQLLGRERELAVLRGLIEAEEGEGSVLLVTGEPGIGKSALLAEAGTRAAILNYCVLTAAGVESEMHLPFGGLQQLTRPLMGNIGSLPRTQSEALSTALGLFDGPRPDIFLIAEAALNLLTLERQHRRVLAVADDVQWLDPQSHQILTFVAHRSAGAGLRIIGAARTDHPGPFVDAAFPRLEVVGVDGDTADAIVQSTARDLTPADRRRVRHQARGNPLALLELPAGWGEGQATEEPTATLSTRLEQAFAGRISQFPAETKDALLVAATDSSSELEEILSATAVFRVAPTNAAAFAPAVEAGLVQTDGSTITFRHPLVRSGVLQTETVARRQGAHQALADVLESDPFRRTLHRAQSIVGPDDQIADELEATVSESLDRGAVMSAVSSLERSARLSSRSADRGRRLVRAAVYAFEIGRADVVEHLVREAELTELDTIDVVRVEWLRQSLNDDVRADPELMMRLCASARRAVDAGDVDLALNILIATALRCWWADVGADAQKEVLDTLDALPFAHDDPRYNAALGLAEPVRRGADVMAHLSGVDLDAVTDADLLRTYGMTAYAIGDSVLATDLLDRAEQALREKGRLGLLPVVLALQFHIRLDLGDWTGSAAASQEVDRVAVETGQSLFAFNNVLVLSRALAMRGEWEAALELVVGAENDAVRLRLNDALCLSYQTRGAALLSGDQPAEAFACLKRQFDPGDPGYHLRESFAGVALMAEAAVDCGRIDEAREILAALESVARATPAPILQVNLMYARAVLAAPHEAEASYRTALEQDLSRWPWVRARICLEYGRWLWRAARPVEAVQHLTAADDVFRTMGATRWTRRAQRALHEIAASSPHQAARELG